MKTIIILSLVLTTVIKCNAQDYLINFSGTGASTVIDSIMVENITQDKSLELHGDNQLRLMETVTGVTYTGYNEEGTLLIYPNPAKEFCLIEFDELADGNATIKIVDFSGRVLVDMESYLTKGRHSFNINGLGNGVFYAVVKTDYNCYTGKIIAHSKGNSKIQISYYGNYGNLAGKGKKNLKSTQTEVMMQYDTGDRLKLTAVSGIYSTVVMDVPIENKTIEFTFVDCTDGDNNNYPVIGIGTQTWMTENLKTTKYNDNTVIPLVTNNSDWTGLITPAYCWYNNDEVTYKNTYGALYNWYVVDTSSNGHKNVCPTGWHVPSDAQWTILTNYFGGESAAGGKLKETRTTHWLSPNTDATNEGGFSALPGGYRYYLNGDFGAAPGVVGIDGTGWWWTSTEGSETGAWARGMFYNYSMVYRSISQSKNGAFSLRCLKD